MRATAVALVLLSLVGQAAAESRPGYGGAVVGSLLGEPISLDPLRARTHAEVTVVGLIFDTLYAIDHRGRAQPRLAGGAPEISESGTEVKIPIRAGVLFHDGSTLEVSDVVRSLRRVSASSSAWLLAPVRSITAENDKLVLQLHRPAPELLRLLAAPATSITPRGQAPSSSPVGTGAFRFAWLSRSKRTIRLTAWSSHFGGRPYVDRLDLRWYTRGDDEARDYEAGHTHFSQRGAVAFAGHQPKYRTETVQGPPTLLIYLGFGTANPKITGSLWFRRALSMAMSRKAFRVVGSGEMIEPSIDPVPSRNGGAHTAVSSLLPRAAQARAALKRAADQEPAIRAALSRRSSLEILVDETRPDDREIAEKVAAALFRLGLGAKITSLAARQMAARVERGRCDLYIGQLATTVRGGALATVAALAAAGERWGQTALRKGTVAISAARAAFRARLPLLPLFHRGVKVHHRHNLRQVAFASTSRLALSDMFVYGPPHRSRRR